MTDDAVRKQARRGKYRLAVGACGILAMMLPVFGMAGCGKKATMVDPPPGVTDDKFPLIYPDPSTDPKPEYKAP